MAPLRNRPAPMVTLTPQVIQQSRMTNRPPTPGRPKLGLRRPPPPPPAEEYEEDFIEEPRREPRQKMQIQSLKDLVDADEGLASEEFLDSEDDLLEQAAAAAGFDGIIGESAVHHAREECKASDGIANALQILRTAVYQMSKAMAISTEAIDIARLSYDIVVQSAAITLLAALADRDDLDENFIP